MRAWLAPSVLLAASVAAAQGGNELALGVAWLDQRGSEESFRSQWGLQDGVFLEGLRLDLRPYFRGVDRVELSAAGFGAEPWQRASFRAEWDRAWAVRVDYSRRDSYFASPAFDLGVRRDDWSIARWAGSLTYDGLRPLRLRLDARDVRRTGSTEFPFYGLGERYAAHVELDERLQEVGLSVETMTLPVKLVFQQDVASYSRRNRAAPANGGAAVGAQDPDQLTELSWPGGDDSTVPTTRLAMMYRSDRFELSGHGLYRSDHLDADRDDLTGYAIGSVGEVGFVDAVKGAADRDLARGELYAGFAVTPFLTLRARSLVSDTSSDGSLVGSRLLRALGPGGGAEIGLPVDEATFFDRRDTDVAGEIDLHAAAFGLVVAYHDASREVTYQLDGDPHAEREARAWDVTASYAPSRALSVQAGWTDRTFSDVIFRTDAETVGRLWAKVRLRPVAGLELAAYGEREDGENGDDVAGLDREGTLAGLSATYTATSGAFVTAAVDRLELTSATGTVFWAPGAATGVSLYDTDLVTLSLRGGLKVGGRVTLAAGALALADDGESLPFDSQAWDARADIDLQHGLGVSLFANLWSYDMESEDAEDYDVTRYGLSLRWRF
jgi:hypothetical protein